MIWASFFTLVILEVYLMSKINFENLVKLSSNDQIRLLKLSLLLESGVDEVILDTPINRFVNLKQADLVTKIVEKQDEIVENTPDSVWAQNTSIDLEVFSGRKPGNIETEANEAALRAKDLVGLKKELIAFDHFSAKKMSKGMVFSYGSPDSWTVVLTDPPDRAEEIASIPYTGDRKILFQRMFEAIGLSPHAKGRNGLYAIPSLPWKPVRNVGTKTLVPDSLIFRFFLLQHLKMLTPKLIILIGNGPRRVLGISNEIIPLPGNGKFFSVGGINALIIDSLSVLKKFPDRKKAVWSDLQAGKTYLESLSG